MFVFLSRIPHKSNGKRCRCNSNRWCLSSSRSRRHRPNQWQPGDDRIWRWTCCVEFADSNSPAVAQSVHRPICWQLSHLCHTTNHALHHLRLLRFTDFQCVYCVENIGNVLWLCVCIFINRFHLHLARAFWSIIWLRIECLASSCWRARSCWAFCCASAFPPPPPCRPHNGNTAFEN